MVPWYVASGLQPAGSFSEWDNPSWRGRIASLLGIDKAWFGMAIALVGVAMVISERDKSVQPQSRARVRMISVKGVACGVMGMCGQAIGTLLSKIGM